MEYHWAFTTAMPKRAVRMSAMVALRWSLRRMDDTAQAMEKALIVTVMVMTDGRYVVRWTFCGGQESDAPLIVNQTASRVARTMASAARSSRTPMRFVPLGTSSGGRGGASARLGGSSEIEP